MANNDQDRRNKSSYNSDENRDKNQGRNVDDNNYNSNSNNQNGGFMDLDRDGYVGNTGGFYGGTSYLGSNYGADWNSNQNQSFGNYGASGYGDRFNDRQRRSEDQNYQNQNRYGNRDRNEDRRENRSGQNYGNMNYGDGNRHDYDSQNNNRNQRREDDNSYYDSMNDLYGQSYINKSNRGNENQSQNYYESAYGNRFSNEGGNYNENNRGDYGRQQGNQGSYDNDYNRGNYRDMRNVNYGDVYHGNVERRAQETNQAQGGRYREADRSSYNRNEGGGYQGGNYNAQDRNLWDKTRDEVASWFGDREAERRRQIDERMSGEHRGKGPKEYKRSDSRIQDDIHDRLSDDDYVDASDIEVKVENGEVILTGTVEDRNAKRRAEDIVESVSGVRHVENRLRVGQINTVGSTVIRSSTTEERNEDTSTKGLI